MLDNTITLQVDPANNSTVVPEAYTRYDEYQNRSVYTGPNHSLSAKDTMTFYRTSPKRSGNFKGVAKSSIKFTRDRIVEGVDDTTTVNALEIGEVNFSLPVGFTSADVIALRQRIIAALDDDTLMGKLNEQLEI